MRLVRPLLLRGLLRAGGTRMTTRTEAIEHLRGRGFYAAEHDWVMGKTIFVATGGEDVGGVTAFKRAMYIIPQGTLWTSIEYGRPRPDDELGMSLAEACDRVVRLLSV